eukprot:m.87455 g.87455  ORF g.87455 m.87455 type:complete len:61 (+) comp14778_c0_seq8:76-258(+)
MVSVASSYSQNKEDPVAQISLILSEHMSSLNWIESNIDTLQQKLQAMESARTPHGYLQEF